VSEALPTCAFMAANHAKACEAACLLWRAGGCQHPLVSEVMGRKTDLCVRPLARTLEIAAGGRS